MPYELIYTSAEQGLRSGTRGFCTVASTKGLTPNFVQLLEQLSAYRHWIKPTSPKNPVIRSHVIVQQNGLLYHILSRISDPGLDYTNRSNKVAHHIIFDAREIYSYPGGPAELLANDEIFCKNWQEKPHELPIRNNLPTSNPDPGVCSHWQNATGDAGFGGYLAESASKNVPSYFTFSSPGDPFQSLTPDDLLVLFQEAIRLLSPKDRWGVTFTTCYTNFPLSVQCLWRAVPAGAPEEGSLRAVSNANFFDLARNRSLQLPEGAEFSELVKFARTGERLIAPPSPSPASAPVSSAMKENSDFFYSNDTTGSDADFEADIYRLSNDIQTGASHGTPNRFTDSLDNADVSALSLRYGKKKNSQKKHSNILIFGTIILLIFILAAAIIFLLIDRKQLANKNEKAVVATTKVDPATDSPAGNSNNGKNPSSSSQTEKPSTNKEQAVSKLAADTGTPASSSPQKVEAKASKDSEKAPSSSNEEKKTPAKPDQKSESQKKTEVPSQESKDSKKPGEPATDGNKTPAPAQTQTPTQTPSPAQPKPDNSNKTGSDANLTSQPSETKNSEKLKEAFELDLSIPSLSLPDSMFFGKKDKRIVALFNNNEKVKNLLGDIQSGKKNLDIKLEPLWLITKNDITYEITIEKSKNSKDGKNNWVVKADAIELFDININENSLVLPSDDKKNDDLRMLALFSYITFQIEGENEFYRQQLLSISTPEKEKSKVKSDDKTDGKTDNKSEFKPDVYGSKFKDYLVEIFKKMVDGPIYLSSSSTEKETKELFELRILDKNYETGKIYCLSKFNKKRNDDFKKYINDKETKLQDKNIEICVGDKRYVILEQSNDNNKEKTK